MKSMIIIDDERLIRNGLVNYLDWNKLGVEVVALCANGQQGLEAIHQYNPDIVLSDVAMPLMDGVQLLKTIRMEGYIQAAFIFISSFSEFRYAQEAVRYNAFDYLLKPLEANVLEDCVKRCIAELGSHSTVKKVREIDWELTRKLLKSALIGAANAEEAMSSILEKIGCKPIDFRMCVGIGNGIESHYRFANDMLYCAFDKDCIVVLKRINNQVTEDFEGSAQMWACGNVENTLHETFCRIQIQMWLKNHNNDTDENEILSPAYWVSHLIRLAKSFLDQSVLSYSECWQKCWNELFMYQRKLSRISSNCEENVFTEVKLEDLAGGKHLYALLTSTLEAGEKVAHAFLDRDSVSPYTRRVLTIVSDSFSEEIDLNRIARQLCISKSHLASVFKKDMGVAFGEFLFAYRMKIAKTLLEDGNDSISEVGEKVGYPDLAQFSKRFKQYYEVSPRDMLKQLNR